MKFRKSSKVMALAICFAMLLTAMPFVALADEETSPITITSVIITEDGDDLLNVIVNYSVDGDVAEQLTILATTTGYDVEFEGDTVTNIAYIDQIEKPTEIEDRFFTFKIDRDCLGEDNTLYVRMGGIGVNTPAILSEEFEGGGGITIIYGDVNGDGLVDATDAGLVLQYFVGNITEFPAGANGLIAANVNGDGNIDATDAGLILQRFVGNITIFPIEQP